jgi:hypothetical protein
MFKVLVSNEEARQTIAAQLDDIATLVKVSKGRCYHIMQNRNTPRQTCMYNMKASSTPIDDLAICVCVMCVCVLGCVGGCAVGWGGA